MEQHLKVTVPTTIENNFKKEIIKNIVDAI